MNQADRLLIFSRYPQPGQAKTRLIPALGDQGAAELQRRMSEFTLAQVRRLQLYYPLSVVVQFTGGNRSQMQAWLGADLEYQPQLNGDLGARLHGAFTTAFQEGHQAVVAIGTDCPQLDAAGLQQAYQALRQADVVLGPASDGGYYLIGLRQPRPELFQGIAWSTAAVLEQTVAAATALNLKIAYLPTLTDIDRPQDLPIWEQVYRPLSLIIPTLNEAGRIQAVLAALPMDQLDVIVVDGQSQDGTAELARSLGATVLSVSPGRARQMNSGARVASGEIFLFLHADTQLPPGFPELVQTTLNQADVVAGAFQLKIDADLPSLRLIEQGVNLRSRWLQLPYGDQALFLTAARFRQMGGFADLPLMEDFELVQRLRQQGRIALAPAAVTTSARRWLKLGVARTTLINQLVILGYLSGVPLDRLVALYRGQEKRV